MLDAFDLPLHYRSDHDPTNLKLPDLDTFAYGTLDDVSSLQESQLSTDVVSNHDNEGQEDDLWAAVSFEQFDAPQKKARTWEQYYDPQQEEKPINLSEASPAVWDAAWIHIECRSQDEAVEKLKEQRRVFRQDVVLSSLFELGMGFNSTFFTFEDGNARARIDKSSCSSLSVKLTAELVSEIGILGQMFRKSTQFVRDTRRGIASTLTVAAAAVLEQITFAIRKYLTEAPRPSSLLQLQGAFSKPRVILQRLVALTDNFPLLGANDVMILNYVYGFAQTYESADLWFRPIALHILNRVLQPYFRSLEGIVGLRKFTTASKPSETLSAMIDESQGHDSDGRLSEDGAPCFLDLPLRQTLVSTAQSLKLLEEHDRANVLFSEQHLSEAVPQLEMAFGWQDIERIQNKANEYANGLKHALGKDVEPLSHGANATNNKCGSTGLLGQFVSDEDQVARDIFNSYNTLNGLEGEQEMSENDTSLRAAISEALDMSEARNQPDFIPPLSIVPSASISPLLSAQSRLINCACLKMIFLKHDLIHHFDLQYHFQLLGFGAFTVRLDQALFSSSLSSAERKKGRARAGLMGLRLGSRESWPPASAELRLVLMGILSESYQSRFPSRPLPDGSDDLPGGLSFAVRNLSEPEIQACLDSASLQALDFLRLQYRPPAPLDAVISEAALEKYDRVFRLLMRVNRVSFVVNHSLSMKGDAMGLAKVNVLLARFRIEARHFTNSLSLYIHSCISSLWARFMKIMTTIEQSLKNDDFSELGENDSLFQLRQLHEAMLDQILFELLLRRRQEKVIEVLEDILSHILEFSQLDVSADGEGSELSAKISTLYNNFKEKVKLFIAVCRGLSAKGAYKVGKSNGLENTVFAREWRASEIRSEGIGGLVVVLDMNGWYQRQSP